MTRLRHARLDELDDHDRERSGDDASGSHYSQEVNGYVQKDVLKEEGEQNPACLQNADFGGVLEVKRSVERDDAQSAEYACACAVHDLNDEGVQFLLVRFSLLKIPFNLD